MRCIREIATNPHQLRPLDQRPGQCVYGFVGSTQRRQSVDQPLPGNVVIRRRGERPLERLDGFGRLAYALQQFAQGGHSVVVIRV